MKHAKSLALFGGGAAAMAGFLAGLPPAFEWLSDHSSHFRRFDRWLMHAGR